jgi:hypothetical protein
MVHTQTIGRKLKTKCRLCVILLIDSAINLNTLTGGKIQNKRIPLSEVIAILG